MPAQLESIENVVYMGLGFVHQQVPHQYIII